MLSKIAEKEKAIRLRKEGFSYSEILKEVPVAKSTLSLWLRSVGLAKRQKRRLTEKKRMAALRGAQRRKEQRLTITEKIITKAIKDIKYISKRDLWLIGTSLYWAEGEKEKKYRTGVKVSFGNSDPKMISIFLKWLEEFFPDSKEKFIYDLYVHETSDWNKIKRYWSKIIGVEKDLIRVYFKKNKINTRRKNTGNSYLGVLRITLKRSTNLNRKISGWIEGIFQHCGVV